MRDAGLADQFGRLYCHSDWGSGATTATIIATLQGEQRGAAPRVNQLGRALGCCAPAATRV